MHIVGVLLLGLFATPAFSQPVDPVPVIVGPLDHNTEIDAIHRRTVSRMRRLGLDRTLPRALPRPILEYPLRLRPNAKGQRGDAIGNFVDLDATTKIKEFTCGSRSYDGHRGIDYLLWPFYWTMMDKKEVEIVAAASGSIAGKNDGEFDRECTAGSRPANHVIILQDDGVYAYYWHMKKGSVTRKAVGSRVVSGEYLGLVGSSGSSTAPHLHLEFRTANTASGVTVDPYAGKCGDRKTSWKHQHEDNIRPSYGSPRTRPTPTPETAPAVRVSRRSTQTDSGAATRSGSSPIYVTCAPIRRLKLRC